MHRSIETEAARGTISPERATGSPAGERERLERVFGQTEGKLLVAYSGGVDSTLVLAAAHRVLGDRVLGVTAVSPSLPASELAEARRLAAGIGARHLEMAT